MSQEINGYLLRERVAPITMGASGVIGTPQTTVDIISTLTVIASVANLNFTLASPTDGRPGRVEIVTNAGGNTFFMYGVTIPLNHYHEFVWSGSTWMPQGNKEERTTRVNPLTGAPGGVIPQTFAINGVALRVDSYLDYDGGYATPVTMPVPLYDGQTFYFRHDATFDTTINTTNTALAAPLVLNASRRAAEFVAVNGKWYIRTEVAGADFWRSEPGALLPDGTTDTSDAIVRTGQTKIDTGAAGDSGLTLDDLRSRNSAQAVAGDAAVTDTNMTALGVDLVGKVRLSNALSYPDIRGTNPNPQDYAAGTSYVFKQSATVGLTGAGYIAIPTYVGVETTRRYANSIDFSGGPVIQRVFLEDGRSYYRVSTGATTWGPWLLEGLGRSDLQRRFTSQANTKISLTGEIRWSGFYHIMTTGTNGAEPAGHFRIDMPADGFAVPVAGGGTRAVVPAVAGSAIDTGGILLNAWETLWYRHPYGQGSGSVPANFLIVPYTTNTNASGPFTNADEWIKIASRDDASVFSLGTGDVVGLCSHTGRGGKITADNWSAMKQRAMGDGYFFCPGGNTAVPTAFGYTGTIRWIDGGATPSVNGAGYRDAGIAQKVAGTAVRGVNGAANRAWRVMTAAEKPTWFGGALRGVNAIVAASSTVVDLLDNETLYFVPNIESAGGTEGQWVVAGYAGFVSTPVHWLPIASKQQTGALSTIQVLVGGMQMALRAGEAQFSSIGGEHFADAQRRKVTHKGIKHCRWTQAGFFAGAAAQGLTSSADGLLITWDDFTMIYGISDGYASWGNQYTYINVPSVGAQIPLVTVGSNVTRQVVAIGGRRFFPLAPWEALYFIPPAYTGGTNSADGDYVVGYYNGNHHIPRNAILIAKYEAVLSGAAGTTINKTRVLFADGTYMQPGIDRPVSAAVATLYDRAHNSGEWRNVTVAGSTPPGGSIPLPAVAGVGGNYGAPFTCQYRNITSDDDPRGYVEIKGLILLNANVTAASPNIAFVPGAQVYGEPIFSAPINANNFSDNKMIMAQVRLVNGAIGNQNGFFIQAYLNSFAVGSNPYYTLGLNGGAAPGGSPQWVSLDGLGRIPCA